MPVEVNEADRSRVEGMIRAYLHSKVSIAQVRGAVSSSSFRAILDKVEVITSALSGDEMGKLMAVLKDELQKSAFFRAIKQTVTP
jgi:hypothetical protein